MSYIGQGVGDETRERIKKAWPHILDAVATGSATLEQACQDLAGLGVRSVQRYARATPGARDELDEALADGADILVERLPSLIMTTPDARRARVLADIILKIATARDPKRYGARAQMDINVKSVDLTQIISNAQARLDAARLVGNAALLGAIEGQAQRMLEEHSGLSA